MTLKSNFTHHKSDFYIQKNEQLAKNDLQGLEGKIAGSANADYATYFPDQQIPGTVLEAVDKGPTMSPGFACYPFGDS